MPRPLCFIHWTNGTFRGVPSVDGVAQYRVNPFGDVGRMGFQGEVAGVEQFHQIGRAHV